MNLNSNSKVMNENWKDVKDFEDVLQVSNLGNVRTKDRYVTNTKEVKIFRKGINKKPKVSHDYHQILLNRGNKNYTFLVHRLVALHFIQNNENLPIVNHKNGNKLDNRQENLEWVTYSQNTMKAYEEELNKGWKKRRKPVKQFNLKREMIAEYESAKEASRQTGILSSNIGNVCNKVAKTAGGFYWEWLNEEDTYERDVKQYDLIDLPNEEWVYINNTNRMYMISNMGRLKSIRWNKILKPSKDKKHGYLKCGIYCLDKKRYFLVHRLVLEHFTCNLGNKRLVNHINGDKTDNKLVNLEWSTDSENQKHQHNNLNPDSRYKSAKASRKKVLQFSLNGELLGQFKSATEASKSIEVYKTYVANHCTGHSPKSIKNTIFCYEEDYIEALNNISLEEWHEWKINKYSK